jgi:multidrug efflux pump subunit AcrA (membrane-fusion protein)
MSEEEMQKKMEFIIEQQAQFAVNIGLLREAQQRTEERLGEVATAQAQMARAQTHMNEVVAVMAEAQERMAESQERMIEAQERTDQKLAETDERLNTLINIVERHISEGHNG